MRARLARAVFPWGWALLVGVAALGLHLVYFSIGDLDADTDFYGDLVRGAQRLAHGELAARNYPFKGPLFSFALVAVHALWRDWYHAAALVNALCAVGILVGLYRLLRVLFDRRVACWSLVLVATTPEFFLQAHGTQTDLLFLLLVTAALWGLCTGATATRALLASGALAGLAFLTRYNGAVLPIAAALVLIAVNPAALPPAQRWPRLGVWLGGFIAVCAPWLILTYIQTGHFLYSKNLQNIAAGLYDPVQWASLGDTAAQRGLLDILAYDPAHELKQFGVNLLLHLRRDLTELLGIPLAAIGLLGILGVALRRPSRPHWSFNLVAIAYFVSLGAIFYATRFSLPLVPSYIAGGLAFLFGVAGPARFGATPPHSATTPRWRGVVSIALACALGSCAVANGVRIVREDRFRIARRPLHLLAPIEALRKYAASSGGGTVMARKGHIALHAGLDYIPYPRPTGWTHVQFLTYLHEHQVRYVSFGRVEFELLPDLRYLAMADTIPGTHDVFRGDGERIFECDRDIPVVTDSIQAVMWRANAAAAARRGEHELESHACNVLAQFYMDRGQPAETVQYLVRAVALSAGAVPGTAAARVAATCRSNLGMVLLVAGRPAEARPQLEQVLHYFDRWGSRDDRANTLVLLAAADQALNDIPAATSHLHAARELFSTPVDQARADSMLGTLGRK